MNINIYYSAIMLVYTILMEIETIIHQFNVQRVKYNIIYNILNKF